MTIAAASFAPRTRVSSTFAVSRFEQRPGVGEGGVGPNRSGSFPPSRLPLRPWGAETDSPRRPPPNSRALLETRRLAHPRTHGLETRSVSVRTQRPRGSGEGDVGWAPLTIRSPGPARTSDDGRVRFGQPVPSDRVRTLSQTSFGTATGRDLMISGLDSAFGLRCVRPTSLFDAAEHSAAPLSNSMAEMRSMGRKHRRLPLTTQVRRQPQARVQVPQAQRLEQ